MRLSTETARQLFAGARVARLATVAEDGQPHLVPVTFAVLDARLGSGDQHPEGRPAERADGEPNGRSGDRVAIAIDRKPKRTTDLKRLRNIRANPRASVLADHYEDDWTRLWWVRGDGHARVVTDDSSRTAPIRALASKYPQYRRDVPDGPVILIDIERWTGWAYEPPSTDA